jgi:flagellin
MPTAISGGGRIRTNIPAMNAYNSLQSANNNIATRQLRLSTGKRINSAADDVAGYITSRALIARNGALGAALTAVGEAKNVTSITQDALDNVTNLLTQIKDATANASSGAQGDDEKVALAKLAYRLSQQIQDVVDSSVFGDQQLLQGSYTGDWTIGYYADDKLIELELNLSTNNVDYNLLGGASNDFNLNATRKALDSSGAGAVTSNFAGVENLSLESLDSVSQTDLGIFSEGQINNTLTSLANALTNVSKVASYVGAIEVRLGSQEELLTSQITNYKAAISRIEDADVATEQMELIKAQFLQQSSLISLSQSNQNPQSFLQLFG